MDQDGAAAWPSWIISICIIIRALRVMESFGDQNTLDDLLVSRRAASCAPSSGRPQLAGCAGYFWQHLSCAGYWDSAREMRTGVTTGDRASTPTRCRIERNRREPGVHDGAGAHEADRARDRETGVRIFSRCFTR